MAAIQTNTLTLNESKKYIINNIKEQIRCLKTGDRCSVVLISGPPGIGKSDLMEQIASELGFGLNAQYPVSYTHLDVYKRQHKQMN